MLIQIYFKAIDSAAVAQEVGHVLIGRLQSSSPRINGKYTESQVSQNDKMH